MAVFFTRRGAAPVTAPPVGTTWLYEEDGTFEVPIDGSYQIEIHGGGGGAACHLVSGTWYSASGGGSGELITISLTQGDSWPIVIGAGGASNKQSDTPESPIAYSGGTTTFGSFSVPGGGGGYADAYWTYTATGGSASGSIASDGVGGAGLGKSGGQGNINNTDQTYGDGGSVLASQATTQNGQPGAVIITFMG